MTLHQGVGLALDRILKTPVIEQIQGVTEPEQLEVLEPQLSKVKIPQSLLPRMAAVGVQPALEPTTFSTVRIPQQLTPQVQPATPPPVEEAEGEAFPEEGINFSVVSEDGEEFELTLQRDYSVWYQGKNVGRIDKDTKQFIPTEPSFWQQLGLATLSGVSKAAEVAFKPFTESGVFLRGTVTPPEWTEEEQKMFKEWDEALRPYLEQFQRGEITEQEYNKLTEEIDVEFEKRFPRRQELRKRVRETYENLPWWQQLL